MKSKKLIPDFILWTIIIVYSGVIYSTVSLVTIVRKFLAEKYGEKIFDLIYWLAGTIIAAALIYTITKYRGKDLLHRLSLLFFVGCVTAYFLTTMANAVERIHFIQYGILGMIICKAISRHIPLHVSVLLATAITYWIGLGDEFIQWMIPQRVGEIRDSLINGFSGLFGALCFKSLWVPKYSSCASVNHLRMLCLFGVITTIVTSLFLTIVHGFGYRIDRRDCGHFYSTFSENYLEQINNGQINNPRHLRIYTNEAIRHLYQREYYLTNPFKVSGANWYYLQDDRSYFENLILEKFYSNFLHKHKNDSCGNILAKYDKKFAQAVASKPVILADSVKQQLHDKYSTKMNAPGSRVKSTIITSFKFRDIVFYSVLIIIVLGYFWIQLQLGLKLQSKDS